MPLPPTISIMFSDMRVVRDSVCGFVSTYNTAVKCLLQSAGFGYFSAHRQGHMRRWLADKFYFYLIPPTMSINLQLACISKRMKSQIEEIARFTANSSSRLT